MSSSTSGTSQKPKNELWTTIAPYVVPPIVAAIAIVPPFRDLIAKSLEQRGQPVPSMTMLEGMKNGMRAAPTVGAIVGSQMIIQRFVENLLIAGLGSNSFSSTLASSAIVGIISAPVLAVFNGQTMGWGVRESLQKFTPRQGLAISVQETAFVAGISAADKCTEVMKNRFGDNKLFDYAGPYLAGFGGSLVGHPANTALTRWQSGLPLESLQQSMWGSIRKAKAVACFTLAYKCGNNIFIPKPYSSEE